MHPTHSVEDAPASGAAVALLEARGASSLRGRGHGLDVVPTRDGCLLRREGDYWTIVYDGQVVRIRDVVGLRHLAQLLWHPQREFHALDLMRALALSGASRGGRPANRGAAEIDPKARTAYRRSLRELEEELADAKAQNDLSRTDRVQCEFDAILRELRHGTSGRQLAADAGRARVAVTKTIKAALGRIRAAHPALATHLEVTVKRGYLCVYRPDPRWPIRWDW